MKGIPRVKQSFLGGLVFFLSCRKHRGGTDVPPIRAVKPALQAAQTAPAGTGQPIPPEQPAVSSSSFMHRSFEPRPKTDWRFVPGPPIHLLHLRHAGEMHAPDLQLVLGRHCLARCGRPSYNEVFSRSATGAIRPRP